MEQLRSVETLIVHEPSGLRQSVPAPSGSGNVYEIKDLSGRQLYFAAEEPYSIAKTFIATFRATTIQVMTMDGNRILRLEKDARLFLETAEIFNSQGKFIGAIKKCERFKKNFLVLDSQRQEIFQLEGPRIYARTFKILQAGIEIGSIKKKPPKHLFGYLVQFLSTWVPYYVTFPAELEVEKKGLLMCATLFIYFLYTPTST